MSAVKVGAVAVTAIVLGMIIAWRTIRDDAPDSAQTANAPSPPAAESASSPAPRHRAALEAPAEPGPSLAVQTPPPSGPRVTGRVLDPEGAPVAGASIFSIAADVDEIVTLDRSVSDHAGVSVAKSGPDGSFSVEVASKSVSFQILARSERFGVASVSGVRAGSDVVLRLAAGLPITGRVLDMAGKPVANARVSLSQSVDATVVERSTRSGRDGDYRLDGFTRSTSPWSIPAEIEVEGAGFAPLVVALPRDPPVPFDLVLVRGARIRGRVIDAETREAIRGVHVSFYSIESSRGARGSGGAWTVKRPFPRELAGIDPSEDGTFDFGGVPAEGFHPTASFHSGQNGRPLVGYLAAWKEGWALATDDVALPPEGATIEVTLALNRAAVIEGIVVTEDGRPVEGGRVWATSPDSKNHLWLPECAPDAPAPVALIGSDGHFRIRGVPARRGSAVRVHLVANAIQDGTYGPPGEADLELTAGETARDVRIVVPRSHWLSAIVRVVDARGVPVPGAIVRAMVDGPTSEARSDAEGRASVVGIGNHRQFETRTSRVVPVLVTARGFGAAVTDVTADSEQPTEASIILVEGKTLAGTVEDPEGRAVARAHVDVFPPPTEALRQAHGDTSPGSPIPYPLVMLEADEQGHFHVEDLPDLPLTVKVFVASKRRTAPGTYVPGRTAELTDVRPGGAAVRLVVPKDDAPPTQPLDVVVVDASSGDVAQRASAIATYGERTARAHEISPGRLRFDGLETGRWRVLIAAKDHAALEIAEVVITEDEAPAPLTARLDAGITLHGLLRAATGSLPSKAELRLVPIRSGEESWFGAVTAAVDPDGRFVARGLSAGAYRPVVGPDRPPWLAVGGRPVEIAPGSSGDAEVPIDVVRGTELMISISGKTQDAKTARLDVLDRAGNVLGSSIRPFEITTACRVSAPPGDLVVRLTIPGRAPIEQRVIAESGATTRVRLSIP